MRLPRCGGEAWGRIDMDTEELIGLWRAEEKLAHIRGWDFSHIDGRYSVERERPWDYREAVLRYLRPDMRLLDIDTGGGEFLLSLGHPHGNTGATEAYPPNVKLCMEKLLPLGIDFREAAAFGELPFEDERFDMVINRHGSFNEAEIYRVLKNGGIFVTEQVGAENDRELVKLLLPEVTELPFPGQYLHMVSERFRAQGFEIAEEDECFRSIRFFDTGALVWFARVIEWEFPGFSVDRCLERLLEAQKRLEAGGSIEGRIHRFFLTAIKRG